MPFLEKFTDDQAEFLISLPYRTGFWVSHSDGEGGDEADAAEMQALEAIITSFAEDFCKSELVEELMRKTVAEKARWPEWVNNIDNVPAECRRAIDLLAERVDVRDVTSFKSILMDIAMTVALAYRENDEINSSLGKAKIYMRYIISRITAALAQKPPPTMDEILNISRDEELALSELEKALRLDVEEGLHLDEMEAAG